MGLGRTSCSRADWNFESPHIGPRLQVAGEMTGVG